MYAFVSIAHVLYYRTRTYRPRINHDETNNRLSGGESGIDQQSEGQQQQPRIKSGGFRPRDGQKNGGIQRSGYRPRGGRGAGFFRPRGATRGGSGRGSSSGLGSRFNSGSGAPVVVLHNDNSQNTTQV